MISSFSVVPTTSQPQKIAVSLEKKLPVSAPIKIPKRSEDHLSSEYELNLNFFNPSKMSPPDCWKTRLEQRMKCLYGSNLSNKE